MEGLVSLFGQRALSLMCLMLYPQKRIVLSALKVLEQQSQLICIKDKTIILRQMLIISAFIW